MRRPFIAGNWKMNLDRSSAVELARAVVKEAESVDGIDLAVCPPSVYLDCVSAVVMGSRVALGAQNVYHEPTGAFTGEISPGIQCDFLVFPFGKNQHAYLFAGTVGQLHRTSNLLVGLTRVQTRP